MKNVTILDNPFAANALSILRDKDTSLEEFRSASDQLCQVLISESLNDLPLKETTIETPLEQTTIKILDIQDIVIIPILRAGIAMLSSAMKALPKAKVGFVGLERDETTAIAREYYYKIPKITENTIVLITDPMLATGGSIVHLLERLKETPAKEIRVVSVIAAPEGIEKITSAFPDVKIITTAIDSHLNSQKYIVPGLGDYGDRYFGTEV